MTFFLGIFAKGKSRQINRNDEMIKELEQLILISHTEEDGEKDDQIKEIERNIKKLKKLKSKAKRENNLLKPFRQTVRIFIILILCVFFICLYYFFRHPVFTESMFWFKLIAVFISVVLFFYALYALYNRIQVLFNGLK